MKKILAVAAALSICFTACSSVDGDDSDKYDKSCAGTYVLMNIPYASFYEAEGASGISDFDAVTSATAKSCNGSLTYGNYHTSADTETNKETVLGVTFPVYVEDGIPYSATEITDDTESFTYTIAGRGSSTTLKYSGKQNLYRSSDYSYYKLSETPSAYKTMKMKNGNPVFGEIKGIETETVTAYVAVSSATHHLPNGYEIALYLDENESTNVSSKFTGETAVQVAADNTETSVTLNAVKAAILETSDGVKYGLPVLAGLWRGFEVGFDLTNINLTGKTITKITLIGDGNAVVVQKAKMLDSATSTWADEAPLAIEVKAITASE